MSQRFSDHADHDATVETPNFGRYQGELAPVLHFEESEAAWKHLHEYVLGRTHLVTNRTEWPAEQIVHASRVQSHNESFFRDIEDPNGVSMLPLRHRGDAALRSPALVVVLALLLAKVAQRRLKLANVDAPSIAAYRFRAAHTRGEQYL